MENKNLLPRFQISLYTHALIRNLFKRDKPTGGLSGFARTHYLLICKNILLSHLFQFSLKVSVLLILLHSPILSQEELIGNQNINSISASEKKIPNESQYAYRKDKKWQVSLSTFESAFSLSYNLFPLLTIGVRVNELDRIKGDPYQDGTDYRTLIGGDTSALTLFTKRESKTRYGNVYKRENIFFHYYPENSLLNNLPIYFGLNLGKTYGTFKEETDYLTILTEPIRDPDATIDRRVVNNGYPMTYRLVTEKPNFYFGWSFGFKWITSYGIFWGSEIGTSYRAKPEIDALVIPTPWNQAPISLYEIGVMTNALKAEYESRNSFSMHYLFSVGYAF